MKNWRYDFPHPADVIAEHAARCRNMSMSDRLEKMFGIYGFGRHMAQVRPLNDYRRLNNQAHLTWRSAMEQVFTKHEK